MQPRCEGVDGVAEVAAAQIYAAEIRRRRCESLNTAAQIAAAQIGATRMATPQMRWPRPGGADGVARMPAAWMPAARMGLRG